MRDATECIDSIEYASFGVIKAIFSNQNSLKNEYELYLKMNKLINKNLKSKNKSKKNDKVR